MKKLYYLDFHNQYQFVEDNEKEPTMILRKCEGSIILQIAKTKEKRFRRLISYIRDDLGFYYNEEEGTFRMMFTVKVSDNTFQDFFKLFLKTLNESKLVYIQEDRRK